jgi:hypothetical protein
MDRAREMNMATQKKQTDAKHSAAPKKPQSENATDSNDSQQTSEPESKEQDQTADGSPSSDEEFDTPASPTGDGRTVEDLEADYAKQAQGGVGTQMPAGGANDGSGAQDSPDGENAPQKAVLKPDGTHHGQEPDGKIIRLGEPVTIDATEKNNFAVTNVAHYQEKQLRGSKRTTFVLLYPAGFEIPLTTLKKIEADSKREGDE